MTSNTKILTCIVINLVLVYSISASAGGDGTQTQTPSTKRSRSSQDEKPQDQVAQPDNHKRPRIKSRQAPPATSNSAETTTPSTKRSRSSQDEKPQDQVAQPGNHKRPRSKTQPSPPDTYKSAEQINLDEQRKIEELLNACKVMTVELGSSSTNQNCSPPGPVEQKRSQITKQLEECNGRKSIAKFCTVFGKGLISGVVTTAGAQYIATQCVQYMMGSNLGENQVAVTSMLTGATSAVLSTMDSGWKAWESCSITEFEALKRVDENLRKEEQSIYATMPPNTLDQVKRINSELDQKYGQAKSFPFGNNSAEDLRRLIMRRELYYMMFPYKPKDISRDSSSLTMEQKAEMDREIATILDDYPENKKELKVLVERIRSNSSTRVAKPKRVQRYLFGPPGTGKTTLIARLAKVLGLYLCKISASDLKMQEGGGTWTGSAFPNPNSDTPRDLLGKLGECYREAGHTNFLLMIDELGDTFRSVNRSKNRGSSQQVDQTQSWNLNQIMERMKLILDEEENEVDFKGLGINGDFSRVTVIGAGNFHVPDDAILRRMPETRFSALTPVQKAIAFQDGYKNSLKVLGTAGLTPEQIRNTKTVVDHYLEYMFELDKQFPGGGVIKGVLAEIFTHVSEEMREGITPDQIDEKQMKDEIQRIFESRRQTMTEDD